MSAKVAGKKKKCKKYKVVGDHGKCPRQDKGPTKEGFHAGKKVILHTYRCNKCGAENFRSELEGVKCDRPTMD